MSLTITLPTGGKKPGRTRGIRTRIVSEGSKKLDSWDEEKGEFQETIDEPNVQFDVKGNYNHLKTIEYDQFLGSVTRNVENSERDFDFGKNCSEIQFVIVKTVKLSYGIVARIHFQLFINGNHVLHSKMRINDRVVYMSNGRSMHFSNGDYVARVQIEENSTKFVINENDSITTIMFKNSNNDKRECRIHYDDTSFDSGLESSFGNRELIKSEKNMVLKGNEYNIYVRKTSKNTLTIDAHPSIGNIRAFSLGIASFLCSKRVN